MKKRMIVLLTATFLFMLNTKAQVKDTLPCPKIVLTAPDGDKITEGKKAVFSIQPLGKAYDKYSVTYNWSASNGTITGGQGTASVSVDTKGLKGESITVTVEVSGLRYDCSNVKSTTIEVLGKN